SPRGWSTTSPTRACGSCCVRKASPFQAVKTWKTSTDPDYEAKKNRVLELYALADGKRTPDPGDPAVVICMDEFGPLNLQPRPGKQWAPAAVGEWAAANNVELAYVPFYGSWLNRIEAQFTALRYFALDGTDHGTHQEQASMIRRYIAWRNRHATDPTLRKVIRRAETIKRAKVA